MKILMRNQASMPNPLPKKPLLQLVAKLQHNFQNQHLLVEALSHPSLKQHDADAANYERLELLGDAVLNLVISEAIFKSYTNYSEGSLAKIKAYLVSGSILTKVAKQLGLENYIIMTVGEENSGGRQNAHNLENVMEAVLAAIYLDSNLSVVRTIILRLWQPYLQDIDFAAIDPKTTLQELIQAEGAPPPTYNLISQTGPAHAPIFTIEAIAGAYSLQAEAGSIKAAQKIAAKKILAKMKQ